MRIICPNCAAEYEVETALIPDAGRDVQCSSCGHAWFLAHPDQIAAEESEQALFDPPVRPPLAPPAAPPDGPHARPVDQAVLDVLREEAAREVAQRQSETRLAETRLAETRPVIESQTEMGLQASPNNPQVRRPDATEPAGLSEPAGPAEPAGLSEPVEPSEPAGPAETAETASAVAGRIARLKGEIPAPAYATGPQNSPKPTAGKRSDLLPGIDEINSSLRPAADKRPGAAAAVARTMPGKGGFGRGFLFGLLLWATLVTAYVMAPELSRQFPAIAPLLDGFVGFVDGMRAVIARMGGQLVAMLGGLIQ